MANNGDKDVNLNIRANDESAAGFKSASRNVQGLTKDLKDNAKAAELAATAAAENYSATSKSLEEAQGKAVEARRAFDGFSKTLTGVGDPTRKQVKEFESLGHAAERADNLVGNLTGRLQKAEAQFNNKFSLFESILGDDAARLKAERGGHQLATAIEEAEQSQRRLAGLNAFRQIGEDAELSATRLRTFGGAASAVGGSTASLSASLRAIIDPAAEARSTLAGLEGEITRVTGIVGTADKPMRDYQAALLDLGRIQNDLMRQGAAVDAFRQQEAAVNAATTAFKKAQDDVLRYAAAIKAADAPSDALVANLRQAEAALSTTSRELDNESAKLLRLKAPLDQAGIATNKLAEAQRRLEAVAKTSGVQLDKLNKAAAGNVNGKAPFLGLKPYELTNLGYQLNDVFTQIASGTSVMQTFAQQGPQILQIFPKLLTGAIAVAAPLLIVAGALAAVVVPMLRLVSLNATTRDFAASLIVSADGARYSAAALTETAASLSEYGIKLGVAKDAIKEFVAAGAKQEALAGLTKTAKDFADATGIKIPEAVKKMTDGFFGGMEGVDALDKATNLLTATEYEHIKSMFESGEVDQARAEYARIFAERMDKAANASRSVWQVETNNLSASWNGFLNALANSGPIVAAIREVNRFITDLRRLGEELAAINRFMATPIFGKSGLLANGGRPPPPKAPPRAKAVGPSAVELETQRQIKAEARLRTELQKTADQQAKENRVENARLRGAAEASKAGLGTEATKRIMALAASTEQKKIDEENAKSGERAGKKREAASRKAAAAAKREAAEAEAAIRKRQTAEEGLTRGLETMQARQERNTRGNVDAAVAAVRKQYAELGRDLDAFEAKYGKGAKIGDQTVNSVRAQMVETERLLEQQVTLRAYEEGLKDLEVERAATFAKIAQAQDDGRITAAQAFDETKAAQAELSPQIAKMAADAIAWAEAINAAKPSKEMTSFIARMKEITGAATATGSKSESGGAQLSILSKEQGALNATIAERNARIQTANELFTAGAITGAKAEADIREAVDTTTGAINAQIASILALAQGMVATGAMTQQQFDALSAKMLLLGTTAKTVVTPVTEVRQQLEGFFTQGVLATFDAAAQGIAGLIDGTMGFKDAIGSVWDAFRQFAADFLRQIAMMIIQQMILNALKSAAGAEGGGGIFGSLARMVVGTKHTGGLGSDPSRISRRVSPLAFLNAPRYHSGYTPDLGIKSGEQAAIIKRNEEVLTQDNPRHIKNWVPPASPQQAPQDIKVINTLDPGEFISKGLGTRQGQRAILNFMRANPSAVGNK